MTPVLEYWQTSEVGPTQWTVALADGRLGVVQWRQGELRAFVSPGRATDSYKALESGRPVLVISGVRPTPMTPEAEAGMLDDGAMRANTRTLFDWSTANLVPEPRKYYQPRELIR